METPIKDEQNNLNKTPPLASSEPRFDPPQFDPFFYHSNFEMLMGKNARSIPPYRISFRTLHVHNAKSPLSQMEIIVDQTTERSVARTEILDTEAVVLRAAFLDVIAEYTMHPEEEALYSKMIMELVSGMDYETTDIVQDNRPLETKAYFEPASVFINGKRSSFVRPDLHVFVNSSSLVRLRVQAIPPFTRADLSPTDVPQVNKMQQIAPACDMWSVYGLCHLNNWMPVLARARSKVWIDEMLTSTYMPPVYFSDFDDEQTLRNRLACFAEIVTCAAPECSYIAYYTYRSNLTKFPQICVVMQNEKFPLTDRHLHIWIW